MSEPLLIGAPGIYDLSAERYHADPCVTPSFTRTIGKLLLDASPAHARLAHPRLSGRAGTDEEQEGDAKEDRDSGTVAHAMFLRGQSVVEVVEFDSYRTKAAKEARDAILAAGRVPLKRAQYDHVMRVVDRLEQFRAATGAFTKGKPEQTLIWRTGPAWCRAMVDWLPDEPSAPLWDLKTTGGLANANAWSRSAFQHGVDLQAALYCQGSTEVRDGEFPDGMLFCVIETRPPYGIRVFRMSAVALAGAEDDLHDALAIWNRCLAAGEWPTYPLEPEVIDPPGFIQRDRDWRQRAHQPSVEAGERRRLSEQATVERMVASGNLAG